MVPLGKKVNLLHAAAGYNWSNGQLYYLGVMLSTQAQFIPDLNLDTKITQLEQACSPYRARVCLSIGQGNYYLFHVIVKVGVSFSKWLHPLMFIPGTPLLSL